MKKVIERYNLTKYVAWGYRSEKRSGTDGLLENILSHPVPYAGLL